MSQFDTLKATLRENEYEKDASWSCPEGMSAGCSAAYCQTGCIQRPIEKTNNRAEGGKTKPSFLSSIRGISQNVSARVLMALGAFVIMNGGARR